MLTISDQIKNIATGSGYKWTMFYSSSIGGESIDIGQEATDALFANSRVLRRDCLDCLASHTTIYYKRIGSVNNWSAYNNTVNVWASANNILN